MRGVTEAREISRAQGVAAAEPDATAEVADRSGVAEDAKAYAGSKKPSIRGLDDSSDDVCVGSNKPSIRGLDDSSDDGCVGGGVGSTALLVGRKARPLRRNKHAERLLDESRVFQPDEVDLRKCQALKSAKLQCLSAKSPGTEFCRRHQRRQFYGSVRGVLPREVLDMFRAQVAGKEKKNKDKGL